MPVDDDNDDEHILNKIKNISTRKLQDWYKKMNATISWW